MEALFRIDYHTSWGEQLYVDIERIGRLPLSHTGNGIWEGRTPIPDSNGAEICYHYLVVNSDGTERHEWGASRHRVCGTGVTAFADRWHDRPEAAPFYSSAFTRCFFNHKGGKQFSSLPESAQTLTIILEAPQTEPRHTLSLCGDIPALGNWNPEKGKDMEVAGATAYAATIAMPSEGIRFKVTVRDASGKITWESGADRCLIPAELPAADHVVAEAAPFKSPLPLWRGAGVALPVFSLRSDNDWGLGDFADLCIMADWAASTGQQIVQILPINDTTMTGTWTDSYPYNSISTFALHPIYLRPDKAGLLPEEEMKSFREEARRLNMLPTVDYEGAFRLKSRYMRRLYSLKGSETLESDGYQRFVERNKDWLVPYAAFCLLRDRFNTSDMSDWGEYAVYDAGKVAELTKNSKSEADYWMYIQYHLDRQLHEAVDYCHSAGVALKGDIPIGISRTSVDAWLYPELFNLLTSAGAPPDDFAILGQNWGFPTYNWERMSLDGFAWWKARFRKMAEYFDAYRIDHVLGFFRIWQIPLDAIHGLLGVFYPALPYTPEELERDFGFQFDQSMTRPYITDSVLTELFGELKATVAYEYLTLPDEHGRYNLKPGFQTQREIAAHFSRMAAEGESNRMFNGLMTLTDDVLFIADPYKTGHFHPRITGTHTYAFKNLTEEQQNRFRQLYEHFYYRRNDNFWREKAMWKLPPLIDSTSMLCCAEDLGMIPACVPSVMDRLEILSLKVQRMPSEFGREFGHTYDYPYYSVCTTSTHDMGGIRQWWEENKERTARYFTFGLRLGGEAPYYAEPWICDRIVADHLASPSMLCILPLQDWLSVDGNVRRQNPREEQINDPANPANNWNYRMHLTLEELCGKRGLSARIRKMIAASGR